MDKRALFFSLLCFSLISCTSKKDSSSSLPASDNKESSVFSSEPDKVSSSEKENTSRVSSSSPISDSSSSSSSLPTSGDGVTFEGKEEQIALSWSKEEGVTYEVSYKESSASSYTFLDTEAIQEEGARILGLKKGTYEVKVIRKKNGTEEKNITKEVEVSSLDRSGYAFFKRNEGVGAYNLDGTLKEEAIVLYVTEENKNTISYGSYKGLVPIIQASKKLKKPLDIRLTSSIQTNQFKAKNSSSYSTSHTVYDYGGEAYFTNEKESTYTELDGLTSWVKGPSSLNIQGNGYTYKGVSKASDTDSYFNMADIDSAKDVTIEGVGKGIQIHNWGFTWKKCSSIEVRNLTFADYPEDACSFQGGSNTDMDYSYYFVHHCTFEKGKNNWDCTEEQDKHDGDGAMDLKYLSGFTASYNHYHNDHKTGLIGGSDSAYTKNVTFHHNYYQSCSSRLPLGRRVNLHAYNNYYLSCGTCQDMRASSYTLSEKNLFESCSYPQKVSSGAVIKSVGDSFVSCKKASQATTSTREEKLTNTCKPDGTSDYSSFDTDASLFYYDTVNKKSDVTLLEDPSTLKTTLPSLAGAEE